jgi:hypothetical protein
MLRTHQLPDHPRRPFHVNSQLTWLNSVIRHGLHLWCFYRNGATVRTALEQFDRTNNCVLFNGGNVGIGANYAGGQTRSQWQRENNRQWCFDHFRRWNGSEHRIYRCLARRRLRRVGGRKWRAHELRTWGHISN